MNPIDFSLEVTPKANLLELPSQIRDISITFLPGADAAEVVTQARALKHRGFNPIPHLAARAIQARSHLQAIVQQFQEIGVQQVFVIGGDRAAVGEYHSTLQLLETGMLNQFKLGMAAHPEGTPHLSMAESDQILRIKNEYASATGLEMYIVTQWSLNSEAIIAWLKRIESFNTLPVRIGIAGPTSLTGLIKFAAICGVKTSFSAFSRQPQKLSQLITVQTPDALIDQLLPDINQFHIFPFGGLKRTREWLDSRVGASTELEQTPILF